MANTLQFLPELEADEFMYVNELFRSMTDEQAAQFTMMYRSRRKDTQMMLILSVVGLFAVPGLQRFVVGNIGMGLLYFFTAGLCLIGSFVDLVNYRKLASEYNQKQAYECAQMMRAIGQL